MLYATTEDYTNELIKNNDNTSYYILQAAAARAHGAYAGPTGRATGLEEQSHVDDVPALVLPTAAAG